MRRDKPKVLLRKLMERLIGGVDEVRRREPRMSSLVPGSQTGVWCPSVWHLRLNMFPSISSGR